jgi:acyl-coenzyme A thioesterase PaaI-like protein
MTMDWAFDVITAEEHERLQALYQPLTQAVRDLIDASIRTGVDEATIRRAQAAIEAVTETLEREQVDVSRTLLRHEGTGRPVAWANPAVGFRNAVAPPMVIHHEGDGRYWSEFTLGGPYEGPPGWVHGGICALVLDHILGEAASGGLIKPLFTGTITCKYRRGTPLGPLRAEAWIERTEGIKTFAGGHIRDAEGVTVEAEGIFIMPGWARDAG